MGSRSKASESRQALLQLAQRLPKVLHQAIAMRGEVLAASLSKTHKICGKPNCKCARGDKHVVYQLSWTENGRRRSAHIRASDLLKLQAAVDRYRQLRQCRADLLKMASEGAALIDVLVEALGIPPPD
jgi:hypothetical protein